MLLWNKIELIFEFIINSITSKGFLSRKINDIIFWLKFRGVKYNCLNCGQDLKIIDIFKDHGTYVKYLHTIELCATCDNDDCKMTDYHLALKRADKTITTISVSGWVNNYCSYTWRVGEIIKLFGYYKFDSTDDYWCPPMPIGNIQYDGSDPKRALNLIHKYFKLQAFL